MRQRQMDSVVRLWVGVVRQKSMAGVAPARTLLPLVDGGVQTQALQRLPLGGAQILVRQRLVDGETTRVRLLGPDGEVLPILVVVGEVQVSRPAVGMSDAPAYDTPGIPIFKHDLNFNLNPYLKFNLPF
jgi:hypothetical protein